MSPAVAQARALDRVQGTDSRLTELVLHDGRKLAMEIGGGILPTPSLTRTIDGASSISLQVYDPDLSFLRTSLLSETWDAKIDGLWFRYIGTKKSGKNLTLTLEDRDVALMRTLAGPKSVFAHRGQKNETTRAEFVKLLVEEAAPKLTFICPQLHRQQPIKKVRNAAQAKAAQNEAKENRGKGIGDAKHLTVGGASASPAQKELGETAIRIADAETDDFKVKVSLIAALMTESSMGAASPGNVLQALEPYTKVRSAEEEISGYLTGDPTWTGVTAIDYSKAHPDATYYEIAQAVQKSGVGESTKGAGNYGKFGDEARAWVEAFSGETGEEGTETVKEPRTFEVGKEENYWEAIQRLAKEVNWRAFIVAGRFYFMPETELLQGMVRLAIEAPSKKNPLGTRGIENVDFDFNVNKKVTEVTVTALAAQWKPPPGAVVTLAGYGPASLGFGDGAVKKDKKGQKAGISSNRNAATGEGRARYIVASIFSPLTEDSDARLVTVKLKKATRPLPEPAAKTKTKSLSAGSSTGSPADGMGVLEGTAEDIVNQAIFYAQKNGFPDITPETVRAANAQHGPTVDGNRSNHQGPPATNWAADMSNGYATPEETHLAAAIAKAFGIPWDGAGFVTHEAGGYSLELGYKTLEGGDHFTHVHFGCEVI